MGDKESPRAPVSVMIARQLDQEKIDVLSKRVEALIASNTGLRTSAERNEKDTHDIVLYFQREMEMKDDIIGRLNEELVKKEGQVRAEADRLKEKYEAEIYAMKIEYEDTIDSLTSKLEKVENDLQNLDSYKRDKESHDRKLAQVENELQMEKHQTVVLLEDQERKFLESKAQMMKEVEDQKYTYRESALKEARETMDAESKKLVVENKRINEELKFHNVISYEYQVEKDRLEAALVTAKREVTLLTEKEQEYARQNFLKTKEIKALRERVEQLEKAQIMSIEKYKARTKELKGSISKELEDATLDAAGLRRLIMIKNKELRHMKTLAATILEQRSEMEQFFLDALAEVKHTIQERKRKSHSEAVQEYNQKRAGSIRRWGKKSSGVPTRTGTFPSIKVSQMHHLEDRRHESNLPTSDNQKVYIQDLTWEDKELVLRLLFAKMNGTPDALTTAMQGASRREPNGDLEESSQDYPDPVFVSEGKGLPVDESNGSYTQHFTGSDFTEPITGADYTDFAIPYSADAPKKDSTKYPFSESEGTRPNLA